MSGGLQLFSRAWHTQRPGLRVQTPLGLRCESGGRVEARTGLLISQPPPQPLGPPQALPFHPHTLLGAGPGTGGGGGSTPRPIPPPLGEPPKPAPSTQIHGGAVRRCPMLQAPHLMPPPPPGPECLRTDPSGPLPGMFCQVSGECGGRLPSGGQGCPQCSEESTAAETPIVPAALTPPPGHTALMARLTGPRLPGPNCTPRSCSVPSFPAAL